MSFPRTFGLNSRGGQPAIAYCSSFSSGSDATSHNFAGQSIGTAGNGRLIAVMVAVNGGVVPTTCSVGSIALVRVGLTGNGRCALFQGYVQDGTTATISTGYSGSATTVGGAVWSITGHISARPSVFQANDNASVGSLGVSPVLPVHGVSAVVLIRFPSGTATGSWATATERYDSIPEAGTTFTAADYTATTGGALTFTCTFDSASTFNDAICGVWR